MKYFLSFFPVLAIICLLTACQREVDVELPRDQPLNDSGYLKAYIELDTTAPQGFDTLYKQIYVYDVQKRLSHTSAVYYGFGSSDISTTNFFYTGTDSLPFKYIVSFNDAADTYIDTVFLNYAQGLVTYDSTIEYNITTHQFMGSQTVRYTASGNNTIIQSRGYFTPGPSSPIYSWSGLVTKSYLNGNIITQQDTSTFFVTHTDRAFHEVSYDNKVNPFYRVEIPYPVLNKFKIQRNNVLEEKSWDVPSSIERHIRYSYTYNIKGQPVSVRITNMLDPTYEIKGVFLYTAL